MDEVTAWALLFFMRFTANLAAICGLIGVFALGLVILLFVKRRVRAFFYPATAPTTEDDDGGDEDNEYRYVDEKRAFVVPLDEVACPVHTGYEPRRGSFESVASSRHEHAPVELDAVGVKTDTAGVQGGSAV
jgi:hypothetical protein